MREKTAEGYNHERAAELISFGIAVVGSVGGRASPKTKTAQPSEAVRFQSRIDRGSAYTTLRFLKAARAIRPPPNSAIVTGSGTGWRSNSPENVLEMLPPPTVVFRI